MKKIHSLVVLAALAIGMAAPAFAAQSDPEIIIYRFPGVRDNGGGNSVGVATVFHCTNFSGVPETIRLVTRQFDGTLTANISIPVNHLATATQSTHNTTAYADTGMGTGAIFQGTTAIAATS